MSATKERFDRIVASGDKALADYRSILSERNLALLLGAGALSEIGDWFNTVALISLSYRFSDGPLGVGGMLAVRMSTRLFLQGPAGTFVDRHAGRKLLFTTQLLMALIAAAFASLVVVPALWLLYALVILLEATNCLARPTFMVEVKEEAPEERRAAANGALFASQTTAQLVGPVLGGLALAAVGAGAVFVINGLTFLGVALAVTRLHGGLAERREGDGLQEDVAASVAASPADAVGYAWLLRRRDLALYLLVCLSLALLVQATIALFIVRATTLRVGDGGVGLFFAAVAVGSIVGSIVAGARLQRVASLSPAAVAMGMCAAALAAFGAAGSAGPAMIALVVAGFATDFYEVVGLTYFQRALPHGVYARFYSVFLLALSAGSLVGALAGPTMEGSLGVTMTLFALALPGLALALLLALLAASWPPVNERHGV